EDDETVVATLSSGTGYVIGSPNSATVVILDNDLVRVMVIASDAAASEPGTNTGAFTFSRNGFTSSNLVVNFTVSGTATPDVDYTALTNSVTIPAASTSASVTVRPLDDTLLECAETVVVTISSNVNYHVGTPDTATVTIAD